MTTRSSAARTWKARARNERGVRRRVTGVIRRCHGSPVSFRSSIYLRDVRLLHDHAPRELELLALDGLLLDPELADEGRDRGPVLVVHEAQRVLVDLLLRLAIRCLQALGEELVEVGVLELALVPRRVR